MYVCVCVMYVCMYVCVYVCMYVYVANFTEQSDISEMLLVCISSPDRFSTVKIIRVFSPQLVNNIIRKSCHSTLDLS